MSDVQISDGLGGTATVGTRTMADGSEVQEFLLVRSDTTTTTYSTVDANGVLVNLGTNNDVTVAGGTVTVGGTADVSVSGTATVDLGANNDVTLNAGTNLVGYVGLSADGTAIADLLSLTNGTAVAVGIYDEDGDQVSMSPMLTTSVTPTLGTATAYTAGDVIDGVQSFTSAAKAAGSGHIVRMTVVDADDIGASGDINVHFFEANVTAASDNAAHALSDADALQYIGSISTTDGTWQDHTNNQTVTVLPVPPVPFKLDSGTTLYAIPTDVDGATRTSTSGLTIKLQILPD